MECNKILAVKINMSFEISVSHITDGGMRDGLYMNRDHIYNLIREVDYFKFDIY